MDHPEGRGGRFLRQRLVLTDKPTKVTPTGVPLKLTVDAPCRPVCARKMKNAVSEASKTAFELRTCVKIVVDGRRIELLTSALRTRFGSETR
ncbi:MAG TPA: hypothetical protein VM032_13370 [Vicinamibacterales bacterium]|nr:hypothetical protein [Vicinamibacterales bacterium]